MSDELVKRLRNDWDEYDVPMRATDVMSEAADHIEALTADRENRLADLRIIKAERDRLRGGIEYVLDGYGLNGPDYRFKDGEDGDWISDRLIAVMKGETP